MKIHKVLSHRRGIGAQMLSELRRWKASRYLHLSVAIINVFSFAVAFVIFRTDGVASELSIGSAEAAVFAGLSLAPYFSAFIGNALVTGELSSGFGRLLYGFGSSRLICVSGKLIAVAVLSACLALAVIISGIVGTVAAGGWYAVSEFSSLRMRDNVFGSIVAVGAIGVIGASIGFIAKRSQQGILMIVFLTILAPILASQLARQSDGLAHVLQLLPLTAVNSFIDPLLKPDWESFFVLFTWCVVTVSAAFVSMRKTDL